MEFVGAGGAQARLEDKKLQSLPVSAKRDTEENEPKGEVKLEATPGIGLGGMPTGSDVGNCESNV